MQLNIGSKAGMGMKTETSKTKTSTSSLLNGLFKASELTDFVTTHDDALKLPTLTEHLDTLCKEKQVLRVDVIRRAGIDRSFGFQIFQGTKNPSRDKVVQLAIGFELGYAETQTLLKIARKSALYPRIKRDAALIYCLDRHLCFTDVQALLSGMGSTILGKEAE